MKLNKIESDKFRIQFQSSSNKIDPSAPNNRTEDAPSTRKS